jgi:mannose-6-phosphate isomerase-like protein (cupin superfamily)
MDLDTSRIFERLTAADSLPAGAAQRDKAEDAQSVDHWCTPVLLERAAYLRKLARAGDGAASETLRGYEGHAMMLSVRLRSGVAEFHARFADLFIVLDGRATLISGGTIVGAHEEAPGEIRGSSIEGGMRRELRAGDVAHIPAGKPHQIMLSGDKGFASLVMKIEQSPQEQGI